MRLTDQQKSDILKAIKRFLPQGQKAQVYLFGSRTQDHLKGGDIDLIILMPNDQQAQLLMVDDYKITAEIKKQKSIDDQKVDLKIIGPSEKNTAFFLEAFKKSLLLEEVS